MPVKPSRSFVTVLARALVALSVQPASAAVLLYQNGFESADTCAWTATVPAVTCDPRMVFVPAGEFTMGSNSGLQGEDPEHLVNLSSYWIDRTDVTVDDYAACVTDSGCTAPAARWDPNNSSRATCNWGSPWNPGNHPINCVDWFQAQSYCAWAGKRLPTEAEWEKAARGTNAQTYPWGEADPTCAYASMYDPSVGGSGCGSHHTEPVGSHPAGASPYGVLDMAGGIWQFVNDWYDLNYYAVSPLNDPPGPASSPFGSKVVRGGSWNYIDYYSLLSWSRYPADPSQYGSYFGFRCARSD